MTKRLFLSILLLASMVVLPTSVKAIEPIEWTQPFGGQGKVTILSPNSFVQEENADMCFRVLTNGTGDLLVGYMNISTPSLGNLMMYFNGSVLGKDMRITFSPMLFRFSNGNPEPITGEEPIAFAAGTFDKKRMAMNFVIQSPNLLLVIPKGAPEHGTFTGNFEVTQAGASTFCVP